MSRPRDFLGWLENRSDSLSPIVVKEVRQLVRAREFMYSFGASLVAGLMVASFGAGDALTGKGTSGSWTFAALMGCLAFLGLAVVPLGAFSALRNERMEQTLELITLTALSPRRVVIGKLLTQGVKLATLFAAMAPFIAMSFVLGGIDFVTILVSILVLFLWSVWACALCLCLSTLFKARAMSVLVFGAGGVVLFVILSMAGNLFMLARRGGVSGPVVFGAATGSGSWMTLAIATSFCLASMANLVFLAENRLSLPSENRVTPLRTGFLVQFLLIAAWTLTSINGPAADRSGAVTALGIFGGLHLGMVAIFTVTEDLVVSRRAFLHMKSTSRWRWLLAMFRPGGGRGAVYVLAQMAVLLFAAWMLGADRFKVRWLVAVCGYVCFFTGAPVFFFRLLRPARAASLQLRVAVMALVLASVLLPDILYYLLWRPDVFDLKYSARHLLNPFRTLANWPLVETRAWFSVPVALGLTGLLAYLGVIFTGMGMAGQPATIDPDGSGATAGEPGSAHVLY
ncbi:MAG: hypothetical protein A3H96_25475 [Acidobacteria bacterium RIFCSPLOWO2_02_FULL_67_36]|nr:MAG: hypothetical protein A3H96_25475 [Acidobacteria bacterium RIFCSPLOWO2_02_FULL_67_36]OFW22884.1 MAG: hypothetical protein A3G21_01070 [Acidobacteria bacterium RIFCSPLOWO2_12_FULL_66_21]